MKDEQRQENLEEIKKYVEKEAKKKRKTLSQDEVNKLMADALENVDFLKVIDEISVASTGKRVIFVDGKACLVYDSGVFYIEDSMDTKKGKKKLTKQQATELYVEYFFRYILNPAIEQKKLSEQVKSIAIGKKQVKSNEKEIKEVKENNSAKRRVTIEKENDTIAPEKKKALEKGTEVKEKVKQVKKEEYIR